MSVVEKVEVEIRFATETDVEHLAELGRQTFWDSFAADNTPENMAAYLDVAFSHEHIERELSDPAAIFLIGEVSGATVGYAKLVVGEPPTPITGERPVELMRLYVAQDWIGRGIGAQLMQASLDEARRGGHDTMWLGVWEHNDRALTFYRRWGFVDVGSHIFQLGDDPQTDLLMQRSL